MRKQKFRPITTLVVKKFPSDLRTRMTALAELNGDPVVKYYKEAVGDWLDANEARMVEAGLAKTLDITSREIPPAELKRKLGSVSK